MPKRSIYYFLFPFFWAAAFAGYYRAHGAQFVYDHNMWMVEYERLGWAGMRTQFGEKTVHYFFQYTYFILFRLLGWHGWYWTALQTAWHAVNAVLAFAAICRWADWYQLRKPAQIGFVAALFFILSPYHTEAVIWGASIQYMMVTSFILIALLYLSAYLESGRSRYFILTYLFYLISLLTWELGLVLPAMALLLYILSPYDRIGARRFIFTLFIPMSLLVPLYFMFGRWMGGSVLSHYGAATHLNISPGLIVPNITRFILKLFDISLVLGKTHSYEFIQWLQRPVILVGQAVIYLCLVVLSIRSALLRRHQFIVLTMAMSFVALVPMINLYFAYFTYIESDRYVYLCSAFFYGGLAAVIFSTQRYLRGVFIIAFLCIQVFFLHRFVSAWVVSGQIVHGLVERFRWQDAPRIHVLATPDAVRGAWCLRSLPPYGIAIALKAQRGIDITTKIDEVMQYELNNSADSCYAECIGEGVYHYSFTQYGDWFIKGGLGTHGWEDSLYKVDVDQWGMGFDVRIKNYAPGDVVLYQVGDHWKEVE